MFLKKKLFFKQISSFKHNEMNSITLPILFLCSITLFTLSSPIFKQPDDINYKNALRILDQYPLIDGYDSVFNFFAIYS